MTQSANARSKTARDSGTASFLRSCFPSFVSLFYSTLFFHVVKAQRKLDQQVNGERERERERERRRRRRKKFPLMIGSATDFSFHHLFILSEYLGNWLVSFFLSLPSTKKNVGISMLGIHLHIQWVGWGEGEGHFFWRLFSFLGNRVRSKISHRQERKREKKIGVMFLALFLPLLSFLIR